MIKKANIRLTNKGVNQQGMKIVDNFFVFACFYQKKCVNTHSPFGSVKYRKSTCFKNRFFAFFLREKEAIFHFITPYKARITYIETQLIAFLQKTHYILNHSIIFRYG